jgi:hypothetical protein
LVRTLENVALEYNLPQHANDAVQRHFERIRGLEREGIGGDGAIALDRED